MLNGLVVCNLVLRGCLGRLGYRATDILRLLVHLFTHRSLGRPYPARYTVRDPLTHHHVPIYLLQIHHISVHVRNSFLHSHEILNHDLKVLVHIKYLCLHKVDILIKIRFLGSLLNELGNVVHIAILAHRHNLLVHLLKPLLYLILGRTQLLPDHLLDFLLQLGPLTSFKIQLIAHNPALALHRIDFFLLLLQFFESFAGYFGEFLELRVYVLEHAIELVEDVLEFLYFLLLHLLLNLPAQLLRYQPLQLIGTQLAPRGYLYGRFKALVRAVQREDASSTSFILSVSGGLLRTTTAPLVFFFILWTFAQNLILVIMMVVAVILDGWRSQMCQQRGNFTWVHIAGLPAVDTLAHQIFEAQVVSRIAAGAEHAHALVGAESKRGPLSNINPHLLPRTLAPISPLHLQVLQLDFPQLLHRYLKFLLHLTHFVLAFFNIPGNNLHLII